MRKAKATPPPLRILEILEIKFSQTFKDIPKALKNFKFLHFKVDEVVGGPVPTLFGIRFELQTPWYIRRVKTREFIQVSLFQIAINYVMNPYILLVGNPNMNIIHCIRFRVEGAVETGPRTQFSQFFAGFVVRGNILRLS